MDFHALPRRDLQALCKRNAIRANMSNAAMADALRSLQSVEGIGEIRTAAAPRMSAVKSAAEEMAGEKQRHGCPLPRGGRFQAATHKAEEAPLTPKTLQRSQQNTAIRDSAAPVDAEAGSTGKRRTRRSRKSKAKTVSVSDQKEETAAAKQKEQIIESMLFEKKLAVGVGEEQHHGCPLPRGGHGRAMRSTPAVHKTEDATPVPDTLQRTLKMVARVAAVPGQTEEVFTGKRRTRRSRRLKVKVALDKEEEEDATACTEAIADSSDAAIGPAVMSGNSCDNPKDAGMDEEATKPHDDEMSYENPSIYSGKRRTRKSRRAKVKMALDKEEEEATACTEAIVISEKSCDNPKEEAGMDEEATKLQDEMSYENPSIYSGNRWTRRSRRAKVKMALNKKEEVAVAVAERELIAQSFDGVIGSAEVSDNRCNDFKVGKVSVVELGATNFQEGIVEEPETTSTTQTFPSLATMKDSPIRCVSMEESRGPVMEMAQDVSVTGGGGFSESSVDEITFKINPDTQDREDGFSLTGELDQSNLLVNTLDRFVKPMYKFAVKEEKKQGECWWMLM